MSPPPEVVKTGLFELLDPLIVIGLAAVPFAAALKNTNFSESGS